jgi:hypothetical protein
LYPEETEDRKNIAALLKDVLDRPVKLRSGNDVRHITMFQAILEVIANKAVAGDSRASTTIMQLVEKLEIFKYDPPEVYVRMTREADEARQKLQRLIDSKIREGVEAGLKRGREQQDPESR